MRFMLTKVLYRGERHYASRVDFCKHFDLDGNAVVSSVRLICRLEQVNAEWNETITPTAPSSATPCAACDVEFEVRTRNFNRSGAMSRRASPWSGW